MDDYGAWLQTIAFGAGLGAVGGAMNYLFQISKHETMEFSWWRFFLNAALAAFIGAFIWPLIPESAGAAKGSLLMLAGFVSYPLLIVLERRGKKLLERFLP